MVKASGTLLTVKKSGILYTKYRLVSLESGQVLEIKYAILQFCLWTLWFGALHLVEIDNLSYLIVVWNTDHGDHLNLE